jgi:hypothetical protein
LNTLLLFALGDYVRVHKNRFAWLLLVLAAALGFYTIPIMFFPYGALYIWLLGSWAVDDTHSYAPKRVFLKYWLGSGIGTAAVTLALYLPIFLFSFERFFGNNFIAPVEWEIFPVTLWTRWRNTWMEWTATIPPWIVLLGVFGFLVSLIFHKRLTGQKFHPQFAFIAWITTLLLVRRPDMLPRFWLFLVAPLLVWSAAGIIEPLKILPARLGKGWNLAQVSVALLVAFVFVRSLLTIPSLPNEVKHQTAWKALPFT